MSIFLNGVHVPHRKTTADKPAAKIGTPKTVTIPMSMHIGAPATPTVKPGDHVKIGTRIADDSGAVSSPVFASVSGKVDKIIEILQANGSTIPAVVIESDEEQSTDENITPPTVNSFEELIQALRNSGIVGLGGAGFPVHVKLNTDPSRVEALIINGAECEPYITSDTFTMINHADNMAYALDILKKHMGIKRIIIGIESNKKKAIASMKKLAESDSAVEVKVLPSVYPQGGEKVLIYHTTGKIIPVGKLPIDVGCIVLNCTTLAAIGKYLKTGMPLTEKCITVDGGAVKEPQNVIVPIGTSVSDVFEFCGGLTSSPLRVLYGGPMMGISVPNTSAPILKNTNAVLALTASELPKTRTTACIRCGSCTNTCPFGLAPASISEAYKKDNTKRLSELMVNACMECGCCSFICPANQPLVQTNKLAKALLKERMSKEAAKRD